jgi:hypothetical protein
MQPDQLSLALLLANLRVAKVGHLLETVVLLASQTGPTQMRNIELLPRINPRITLVPKAALILEIDANLLGIERSTLIIEHSFPIMIDLIPTPDPLQLPATERIWVK